MNTRLLKRIRRVKRIRSKIKGTASMPRLTVHKSLTRYSIQVIDDTKAVTLVSLFTKGKNKEAAKKAGAEIAKLCAAKRITRVVFDRAGSRYHGAVKALADAARNGGLTF